MSNMSNIITKGLAPCEFRLLSGTRDTPSRSVFGLVWYLCQRFWVRHEKKSTKKKCFWRKKNNFRKNRNFREKKSKKSTFSNCALSLRPGPAPRAKSSYIFGPLRCRLKQKWWLHAAFFFDLHRSSFLKNLTYGKSRWKCSEKTWPIFLPKWSNFWSQNSEISTQKPKTTKNFRLRRAAFIFIRKKVFIIVFWWKKRRPKGGENFWE